MSPPKLAIVTCESVGLLNRSESEHVPKNTLPLATNALLRPVAAGAPPPLVEVGGTVVGVVVDAVPGRHCE